MNKILIVTETTSSLTFEEAKQHNIELLPLSILIGDREYRDVLDLSLEQLNEMLKKGAVPKTSQPNLGLLEETAKRWKSENYDDIIIFTISQDLSGTYQSFITTAQRVGLNNVTVVDSRTAAAFLKYVTIMASQMVQQGKGKMEILEAANKVLERAVTYIYPKDLKQLKKGGRVSATAATMSSLLKIKPLLILRKEDKSIEKAGMARTDRKVFEMILADMQSRNINADDYVIYVPVVDEEEIADNFIEFIQQEIPHIRCKKMSLPAVIVSHVGLGAFGVQPLYIK